MVLTVTQPITVAAYYFPDFHPNETARDTKKRPGWTEWDLLKEGKPRFKGHVQPKIPLWGCLDESDPQVMAKKIDAAADHGIGAFIFDWYWYRDRPYMERCLDQGFLRAPNSKRLKFALMWANHDRFDVFPVKGSDRKPIETGDVSEREFDHMCDHVIHSFFTQPNYLKVEGKPYFSIYELYHLVSGYGGVAKTKAVLDRFRKKAKDAGLPGIYFNAVSWGLEGATQEKDLGNPTEAIKALGIDSVTSYVWIHHVGLTSPQTPYPQVRDGYFEYWARESPRYPVPYFPNVTMGWDPTPRNYQPFGMIVENTPEEFKIALRLVKARLDKDPIGPRMLTIYAWNEWTEGGYLEPDVENGNSYLDAIQDVFQNREDEPATHSHG